MTRKLVSVITPCYNAERYVPKLLDSVMNQTYDKIEMVVVDDGSTDKSAGVIKSYIPKFKERGHSLRYIYQKNQGQSVAVNNALKEVKGDYLVWPDADDYYSSSTAIEKLVKSLDESGDDVGMSRVEISVVNDNGEEVDEYITGDESRYKTDLFESCLFEYGSEFWGAAGGYMLKMSHFDRMVPGRDIYTEKIIGQNWQLCLPVLYKYKCLTIEEKLYTIVALRDSHSRRFNNFIEREKSYYRSIKNTIRKIDMPPEYRQYLLNKTRSRIRSRINKHSLKRRKLARLAVKRAIKATLPYGVVMMYKRRKK